MENLKELMNLGVLPRPAPVTMEPGDYLDDDGIVICGKCGKPKQERYPRPDSLGGGYGICNVDCDCVERKRREEMERVEEQMRRAKVEKMRDRCFAAMGFYRDCTFERDDGQTPDTSALCERFADTFDPKDPYGLILMGDVGTGKSYMSSAIANRVIERGFSAFQTDMRRIVGIMESSSFENRERNLARILGYDLLVIEDLGAQRCTGYMMEHVYDIINWRYSTGKPMVITTNFDSGRLNDAGDEAWRRIFDRILERCYPIQFDGESRRAGKKMEMREAMRKRLGL